MQERISKAPIMEPTCSLRFQKRRVTKPGVDTVDRYFRILQQKWRDLETGDCEWRDVEVFDE